ncbi:unnamed protein product, partial [marine sediment metagenome]
HRCLKNYDYTFVAKNYLEGAEHSRILGLTASPGSKPAVIKNVCENLGIEAVEVRHRYSKDVKPYMQKLTQDIIKVDLPVPFKEVKNLLADLYKKKIDELKNRNLFFTKVITKKTLIELQAKLQRAIASGNKHFNILRGISVCAQAIKLGHAIELLETQTITYLHNYMQNLYEQAKQEKSKAAKQIVKNSKFQDAYIAILRLFNSGVEHPKLAKLKETVLREVRNKKAKIIVFAQYRDSIVKICKE